MLVYLKTFGKRHIFVLGLFASSLAHAQSTSEIVQKAENLLNNESDSETAQQVEDLLFEAVDKNNIKALFMLGENYFEGGVLAKDEERGLAMILEAAALGFKPASLFLFQYYQDNSDYDAAVSSLESLAAEGDVLVNDRLAKFFASGPEEMRDLLRAQRYLDAVVSNSNDDEKAIRRTLGTRVAIIRGKLEDGQFDTDGIMAELDLLASENVSPALSMLHAIYTQGLYGVEADPVKGVSYVAKAESLGDPRATLILGQEYIKGTNVGGDLEKGIQLLERAVERGQERATVVLATLSVEGKYQGMSREEAEAVLSEAADNGDLASTKTLARSLARGDLGEGRNKDALELVRKLVANGNESSQILLADILLQPGASKEDVDEAVSALTPLAQIGLDQALIRLIKINLDGEFLPRDQKTAANYISQLASLTSGTSKKFLADLFLSGELVEKDVVLGLRFLTEAYNSGVASAVVPYARVFIEGEFVPENVEQGIETLENAAAAGNEAAKYTLANLYLDDSKPYSDKAKGYGILEEMVSETDNPVVPFRLGRAYLTGDGVEADVSKGLAYLEEASNRGNNVAPFLLGLEYLQGRNVTRNYRLAQSYLETALERGNKRALVSLGDVYWRNRNSNRALELYREAAEQGEEAGTIKIGLAYLNPARSPGKQAEGLKILDDLSSSGSALASMSLANVFLKGLFQMPVDSSRALSYYDAAIAAGNEAAAGLRLALLAEINSDVDDFEKILFLSQELTEAGKNSFVRSGFERAGRQVAYVVQEKLQELGYYKGALDGLFGQGSQASMLLFCQDDAFNGPCASPVWSPENAIRVLKHQTDAI